MRSVDSYMAERALALDPVTATSACHCAATDVEPMCSLGNDCRADCTKFRVQISTKYPIEPRTEDRLAIGTTNVSGSSGLGRPPLALLAHDAMTICCAGICSKFWPSQKPKTGTHRRLLIAISALGRHRAEFCNGQIGQRGDEASNG